MMVPAFSLGLVQTVIFLRPFCPKGKLVQRGYLYVKHLPVKQSQTTIFNDVTKGTQCRVLSIDSSYLIKVYILCTQVQVILQTQNAIMTFKFTLCVRSPVPFSQGSNSEYLGNNHRTEVTKQVEVFIPNTFMWCQLVAYICVILFFFLKT